MADKQIKRVGYPVGPDDWLVKNGTGGAVVKGQVVGITVGDTLDTAEAVSATNQKTYQAVALEDCISDATKLFRVRVQGIVDALVANATTSGELLMTSAANTNYLIPYATDTKAANRASALCIGANSSGAVALAKVHFDGFRFVSTNRVT